MNRYSACTVQYVHIRGSPCPAGEAVEGRSGEAHCGASSQCPTRLVLRTIDADVGPVPGNANFRLCCRGGKKKKKNTVKLQSGATCRAKACCVIIWRRRTQTSPAFLSSLNITARTHTTGRSRDLMRMSYLCRLLQTPWTPLN